MVQYSGDRGGPTTEWAEDNQDRCAAVDIHLVTSGTSVGRRVVVDSRHDAQPVARPNGAADYRVSVHPPLNNPLEPRKFWTVGPRT